MFTNRSWAADFTIATEIRRRSYGVVALESLAFPDKSFVGSNDPFVEPFL
jgi:hypothetical protein